jgi:hypothetical protein
MSILERSVWRMHGAVQKEVGAQYIIRHPGDDNEREEVCSAYGHVE